MTEQLSAGTRHLVDPTFEFLLELMPSFEFTDEVLAQVRLLRGAMPEVQASPGLLVDRRLIPGGGVQDPDVEVYVTRPATSDAARPAVLWVHGGGYILGSAEESHAFVEQMVRALGCVVVSVNYRLAPDTQYPGPLEDCHAALSWLHGAAEELGVDPSRIAAVGESAGGGLVAALALLVRDRGGVPLCFQGLVYPMIDDRTAVDLDPNPMTGEFIWTRSSNAFGWSKLLGHEPGRPGVSPYAAAARATDLGGLPPAFIGVGALDLFVDENLEYARRLLRAGVPTELHVHPGAIHGYLSLGDHIPLGKVLFGQLADALSAAFSVQASNGAAS